MKKGLLALICLSMLAVAPACMKKDKKPAKPKTTMQYNNKKPAKPAVKKAKAKVKKVVRNVKRAPKKARVKKA